MEGLGGLLLGGFGLVWLLLIACIIANALLMPIALISVMSSLRGIQRELRRMNGMPVPDGGGLFPNATVRAADAGPQSLTHQLTR